MKKFLIILCLGFFTNNVFAQNEVAGHFYGEDAYRFSNYSNFGTARTLGMGGAFTALGGDAGNMVLNPAGLGYYNKSEFSLSPTFVNLHTTSSYLQQSGVSRVSSNSNIGQISAIFNKRGNSKVRRSSFGISYNTLASFSNEFDYEGSNNRSSLMDYFAEQATIRGEDKSVLDNELDASTGIADTPTAMYYWAYLIDPLSSGRDYVVGEPSFPVEQKGRVSETGKLGQINLAYGANINDRTYLGASVGIQTLNYNYIGYHNETFSNGEVFNGFGYADELVVRGSGINFNVGVIQNLSPFLRLGLNVSTPTAMKLNETFFQSVQIDQKPGAFTTDFQNLETVPGEFTYQLKSPLRGNLGLAYMLPQKIGVISVDAEYLGYGRMNIKDKTSNSWSADQNRGIQDYYKDVINLKAGAEIRVKNFRLRSGGSYLADPVRESSGIDRSKIQFAFGLGYRSAKFFADAGFTGNKFTSSYTPYTLTNPENFASAKIDNKTGLLKLSVGTFF